MDTLRAIAYAHYQASPPAVRDLAYHFFTSLDADQDHRVSFHEFMDFMTHEGHTRLANPRFFRDLDRDGNGSLDFWEVLTLYYIVKSGRPLCERCGILIADTFFSCVECFDSPGGSYSLCINCYRSNKSGHNHGGHQQFLDNFTLLQTKKRPAGGTAHPNQAGPIILQSTNPTTFPTHHGHNNVAGWTPPQTIVPAARINIWKAALTALEVGLSIGNISTTLCTIL